MKIMIVLLLTFSVLVDFSSTTHETQDVISGCDSVSACLTGDFHQADDEGHEDEHHCHAGHMHIGIFNQLIVSIKPDSKKDTKRYSVYNSKKANKFHSEVNRPPIV